MSRLLLHAATGLQVDPEKGVVYGLKGKPIGSRNKYGYVGVRHRKKHYHAHRIIWEAVNGPCDPELVVHHINGVKHDNRVWNLAAITQAQNLLEAKLMEEQDCLTGNERWKAVTTIGLCTAAELAEEFDTTENAIYAVRLDLLRRWQEAGRRVKEKTQ